MNSSPTRDRLSQLFQKTRPVIPADRIYALALTGTTQAEIAAALGYSKVYVHQVIHDRRHNYDIASKLAELTGVPLNRLWPDGRYARAPKETKAA